MRVTKNLSFKKIANDGPDCERCYNFWKRSWEQTFHELGAVEHLPLASDGFIYRDKNCLFDGAEPIAIYLTEIISANSSWQDHSYFQMYSRQVRDQLLGSHSRILSLSYIAIAAPWRKSQTDIPILDLVFGLGGCELLESGAGALVSCVRKNRKVDSAFAPYGAWSIGRGEAFHVDVEYMVLERNKVRSHANSAVQKELSRLWKASKGADHERPIGKRHPAAVSGLPEHAVGK